MEEWLFVVGTEEYEVSNLGNVRSVNRTISYSDGRSRYEEGKTLKFVKNKRGYFSAAIYYDKNRRYMYVHRLVAMAFIPNPENKRTINHKDGIKTNNCVDNLEWSTDSENAIHAFKNNLRHMGSGAENHTSIPVIQMSMDGGYITEHVNIREAERQTGAWNQNISKVCKGLLKSTGGYKWKYK